MKVIMHIDLDSFFVSAERTINKDLINKPVVVSSKKKRMAISAVSYEARAFGIKAGMPNHIAFKLCPKLIIVIPNFKLYTLLSEEFFALIQEKYSSKMEITSVDECYIDITDEWQKYGSPEKMANMMQMDIQKTLSLPSSYGISDTKFYSKIATSINKPNGISIINPSDNLNLIRKWSILKIPGIGNPTAEKLFEHNINNVEELYNESHETLEMILGKNGLNLYNKIHKNNIDEIITLKKIKGIGNSTTFHFIGDTNNFMKIKTVLEDLSNQVSKRLKYRNVAGNSIVVSMKKANKEFGSKIISKQIKITRYFHSKDNVFFFALKAFELLWNNEVIKFLGVRVGGIKNREDIYNQQNIFVKDENNKAKNIINNINRNFHLITLDEYYKNRHKKKKRTQFILSDKII